MKNEFSEILETLIIEDSKLQNMRLRVKESCVDLLGTKQIILLLKSKSSDLCICADSIDTVPVCSTGYEPFCSMFKAYASYSMENYSETIRLSLAAVEDFASRGQTINQVLALWGCALAHRKMQHHNLAINKLEDASLILNKIGQRNKNFVAHSNAELVGTLEAKITEMLIALKREACSPFESVGSTPPQEKPKEPRTPRLRRNPSRPAAHLVFPVYDYVRAGREGNFIFDSQPEMDAMVNALVFDGVAHQIYNIREAGYQVVLHPAAYRWLRVTGDSMDQAEPVPILDGDYVLVIEIDKSNISAQYSDIVVASVHNPTAAERAGVIKKYTPQGLRSYSNSTYPIIPLDRISIRGVVIAVAKPLSPP